MLGITVPSIPTVRGACLKECLGYRTRLLLLAARVSPPPLRTVELIARQDASVRALLVSKELTE